MGSYGFLWVVMCFKFLGPYESLWVFMGPYKSL